MLNWAVIGVGDISRRRVIPAIQAEPRSQLRALVTRDPAKAADYGVPACTDLEAALADREIDAVYVATPVYLHAPQSIAALRAGKHVVCEKPVALDYPEACAMRDAARTAGRRLAIAYYRRFFPKVLHAKKLLATSVIGRPVLAEANCHGWMPDEARDWLTQRATAGGGPLYDIASHRIDVLNFLFGKPARVAGLLSNVVHKMEVEDSATVLIDYESGVRGIVDARWNSRQYRDQFRIIGTDGELNLDPLSGPELRGPSGLIEELPAHSNVHYPLIENFVSAVLDGAPLVSSIDTALETSWITEQVQRKT
jgi:1,5-anhydro-D-fructose reductase (1,5-anhydro-D-mannitol-forming)